MMKRLMLIPAFCVLVAACGGGDGDIFSVDSSKKLSELTADEINTLNEEADKALNKLLGQKQVCLLMGLSMALMSNGDQEVCDSTYRACMMMELPTDFNEFDFANGSQCEATVGEAEACLVDNIAAIKSQLSGLSCASDPQVLMQEPVNPASCESLEAQCPALFADDTTE